MWQISRNIGMPCPDVHSAMEYGAGAAGSGRCPPLAMRDRIQPMTAPSIDLPDAVRAQWPYRPRFARVNGWRMHYVDEGAGDPVVLLHGNPTWGFLYRDFVEPLTQAGYRVIVPDMIGFGLSEKPTREDAHSLDGHIANLSR
jgi:alpha-beta hydrolase superfamily lysophospholipase